MPNLDHFLRITISWPTIATDELATAALLLFFIALSIAEAHCPEIHSSYGSKVQSYRTNIALFLLNSALLPVVSASSLWLLADLYGNGGLLKHVPGPVWKIVLAFLALDLMLYFWHRACHRFDGLWMFHRVHHSDAQMNVSTAFRVHILELFLTNILKGLYIIALGVDRTLLVLEETVMTFFIMTHHGNFSLPGENLLKHVIVVPRLHRAHHSVQRNEHDRNYGAVLSLWDRLFGTWTELVPSAIGIHNNPGQDVISQLKLGFTPVTPPLTSVASPRADADADADLRAMVAEAAYYKAQHRGFLPGHDLADWLEAEMEISSLIRSQDPVPVPNRPKNSTSFARCRPALSC